MQLKHMCCIYGLYWLWFQRDLLAWVLLYNMPVQTPLNVYESCGAESLCYWADGWRLESFSSGSGEVEIADRWVMTALQKAIHSAVAGRSWPWYTTLCSRLLLPCHDPVVTCKEWKVQSIVTLHADECLVKEQYFPCSRTLWEIFQCQFQKRISRLYWFVWLINVAIIQCVVYLRAQVSWTIVIVLL